MVHRGTWMHSCILLYACGRGGSATPWVAMCKQLCVANQSVPVVTCKADPLVKCKAGQAATPQEQEGRGRALQVLHQQLAALRLLRLLVLG